MNQDQDTNQKIKRLNGTILTILILAVMVILLILFVMTNDRGDSVTSIALTRTVSYLQTVTRTPDVAEAYSVEPLPVVSVDGMLLMGGLLVVVVLIAVIREAYLHKRA
jgi:uncharacterized integral membrane protein